MRSLLAALAALTLLALSCCGALTPVLAQEHHAQHHNVYQSWINKAGKGCCNNQDCGELAAENERENAGQLEVRIEGQWCPVEALHYLKSGNAPNWQTSHVCVARAYDGNTLTPCERLLCYQPKPGF